MSKTLQTMHRRHVIFNPANAEHRGAYWMLRHEGRQDENLRFILEAPFSGVLAMMQSKIADHFCAPPEQLPAEVPALPARRKA